jgi:indolepyruvate ferredoxin oxidoreductase alpha subunit
VPVILRMTTRINHVKSLVTVGERERNAGAGFKKEPGRFVMVPGNAGKRIPLMFARDIEAARTAETSGLNFIEDGPDRRVGFIASGPAYMHVKESFPDAPVLKLGFSCPLPFEKCRELAAMVDQVVVVEEVEPLVETELKAQGVKVIGKEILPLQGELAPNVLRPADRPAARRKACRKCGRPRR